MVNEQEFIDLVKNKLSFVLKDYLVSFAIEKNFITESKGLTKGDVSNIILSKTDYELAVEIIKRFDDKIGFTATDIEDRLKITKAERIKWTKSGKLTVTGTYEVRAYGTYLDCPIYDGIQILNFSENDIINLRNSVKPRTAKQIESIEKARQTALNNRTCKSCGRVVKKKSRLDNKGLCDWCIEDRIRQSIKMAALTRREYWLENKNMFALLDVETTGLCSNDEIVQIGILDLDGNVLMDQLVKPTQKIPSDAMKIHGITDDMVANSPTWEEVYPNVKNILKGRTVIAYNASFDVDMIYNSCRKYEIEAEKISYECLMYNTMEVWGTDRWISLQRAVEGEGIYAYQEHRAIGDCMLCLALIKKSLNDNSEDKELIEGVN